ncbi:MAG TPA: hypothetical protein VGR22_10440, partial [Thermomicrobiales bacterium]|nr:hypothetical protein [Thermomicrobiales bacterium]
MTERDPIRRAALLATPPLLLMTTAAAFRGFQRQFGDRLGYLAGFLVYWIGWCMLLPLWVLGPRGLRELFRPARHSRKDVALLSAPPALGMVAAFPSAAREATPAVIAGSVAIAVVNGTLEEVLWRGTYQAVFPDAPVTGLYPAVGFAVWHYAPQTIHPTHPHSNPTS